MRSSRTARLFAYCLALVLAASAPASPPALSLKAMSSGQLIAPVNITNADDGSRRLFICDQVGKIWIISDEMLLPTPFLDLSASGLAKLVTLTASYDERGLLGLAFHPGFSNASSPGYRKFYVFYSAPSPTPSTATNPVNCRSTVSEFQVSATNPNVADPAIPERLVISWDKPQSNHNGGQLAFGPDGYLYITIGDGGSQHDNDYGHTDGQSPGGFPIASGSLGNAQDTTKLLGKILRIDPLGSNGPGGAYGIPTDNPFASAGGGVRGEIWAFGLRNPWRLSFDNDPVQGWRLIEADVGQDNVEEINLITKGGNYGWRIKEGTLYHDSTAPSGGGMLIDPVAQYRHPANTSAAISSITPGNPCTVSTPTAHNLPGGTNVTISRVTGGSFSTSIDSTYPATVTSPTQFTVPVNCTSASVVISSITVGNPCTVTSLSAHNLTTGMSVTFSGITGGTFSSAINGTPYAVNVISPTQFTIPVNCTSACVVISSILPGNPCTVTTSAPHNLNTGDSVTISGLTGGNFTPGINNTHTITVISPTLFTVPVNCTSVSGITYFLGTGLTNNSNKTQLAFSNGSLPAIGISVIGGSVYRGSAIPALTGYYVFADYNATVPQTPGGLLLALDSSWTLSQPVVAGTIPFYVMSMGRDEDGELYVATEVAKGPQLNNNQPSGTIYKIVAAQVPATISLASLHDNTIFSESSSLSNALGNIYAGETASGAVRRGLLNFDIASHVPPGSVITTAQLSLNLNFTSASAASNMSLYRLSESWGEGSSSTSTGAGATATVGDATWGNRFYDPNTPTAWFTQGGTHTTTVSATTSVGTASGFYNWSSAQIAADVQGWLGAPSGNYGWLLTGNETTLGTARRFDSRESAASVQPALQVTYIAPPPLTWRETWLQTYFSPIGVYVADLADPNGDGINNLLAYALALAPAVSSPPGSGSQITVTSDGINDTFTITFRRDPRATDLTYKLQTSSDLSTWTTIVQSTAGATPTDPAFVSESDIPGQAPVKIVTAREVLPAPTKRFSRLLITRSH